MDLTVPSTQCSVCKGCLTNGKVAVPLEVLEKLHPASGAIVSNKVRRCGVCERHFLEFLRKHTKRKSGGVHFYDHTETSRNKV